MAENTKQMSLRAIVSREGDEWLAHCLDLDIVSTGASPEAAMDELAEAVGTQLLYAREHDNFDHLFRSAPPASWRKLAAILSGSYKTIVRHIDDSDRGEQVILEVQQPKAA